MSVADLCRRHGISDATFYTWRPETGAGHALAADAARRAEPALEPGLRIGHVEQRTALQGADGCRRLQPGMPRSGRRHIAVGRTAWPRTKPDRRKSTLSHDDRQRQWRLDDLERDPNLAEKAVDAVALYRTGKAAAQRVRQEFQWPVPQHRPRSDSHRLLASQLQRRQAPHRPQWHDTKGVRSARHIATYRP